VLTPVLVFEGSRLEFLLVGRDSLRDGAACGLQRRTREYKRFVYTNLIQIPVLVLSSSASR
jgi:hypothetical protein